MVLRVNHLSSRLLSHLSVPLKKTTTLHRARTVEISDVLVVTVRESARIPLAFLDISSLVSPQLNNHKFSYLRASRRMKNA